MSSENHNQGESGSPKTPSRRASSGATKNPYLNFMREFRLKNKSLNVVEQTVKGAEMWRKMTENQKAPYVELARQARRRPKKSQKGHGRRRRRRRSRRHSMDSEY